MVKDAWLEPPNPFGCLCPSRQELEFFLSDEEFASAAASPMDPLPDTDEVTVKVLEIGSSAIQSQTSALPLFLVQ